MLSKEASNTIFWVVGMTRPRIEPGLRAIGEHSNRFAKNEQFVN